MANHRTYGGYPRSATAHPRRIHNSCPPRNATHPKHPGGTVNRNHQPHHHSTHRAVTADMELQSHHHSLQWKAKAHIEHQSPPAPTLATNVGAGPKGAERPLSRHKKPNYWLSDAAPVAKHQPPLKASPAASPDVSSPARRSSTTSHAPTRIDQCTSNARHLLTQIQFATVSTAKPNKTHVRTAHRENWSHWNVNC